MRRRTQLFIHRYYDTIKLTLLVVLVMLSVIILLARLEDNNRAAEGRDKAVATVIETIQSESEDQTDLINRQFRALCIVIIETSGQEGLDKLDPESRARCDQLSTKSTEQAPREGGTSTPPANRSQSGSDTSSLPQNNTQPQPSQSDNSQQPSAPPDPDDEVVSCRLRLLGVQLLCSATN